MASQDWFEKDFYATLGVPTDAGADDIKKAYRKLARIHHPDANSGDATSEKKFKEIGEAYAVLSDPEQRQQYDAVRAMTHGGARFSAGGAGGAGGPGAGGFEDLLGGLFGQGAGAGNRAGNVRYSTSGTPGGAQFDLDDLFGGIFGAGTAAPGGSGYRSPRGPQRGADLAAEVNLTFRQAVDGAQLNLRVDDPRNGARTITARIPAGVREGQKVRLRGKGRPGEAGAEDGDLVVTVHVEAHPLFTLEGENVKITVPVTFTEAVFGAQIEVPVVDGSTVRMKIPPGTPSGRTLRAKGHGLKGSRRTGDLLVTIQVVVPQRVDGAARDALDAFERATKGENPRADLIARAQRAE
ncbi:MAG: DnaJ domain-containing protein [Kineosporiaceae bacterium]|nr:DnaJ domain-containing protein [Kineosporiaceae bacterium]MBK8074584.1 DnaJ domain-containing protein [Kineosporiaceae bacterium]